MGRKISEVQAIQQKTNPRRLFDLARGDKLFQSEFVRRVGTTMLSQGAILVVSMAIAAMTARWLGPSGKGQFAMVFMAPALMQMFFSVGLSPANVYYAGSGRLPIRQLTENSIAFVLVGTAAGLGLALLGFLCDWYPVVLPGISPSYILLGMIALPLGLCLINLNALLQGLQRIYTLNLLNIAGSLLSISFMTAFLILLKWGLPGAILASLSVQSVMLILTAFFVHREGGRFRPKWNAKVVTPTLGYGLKSYLGNLLQFFNYRFDMFIVNFFLGPAGVGIYGVSVVMAELLWQLPNAVSFVIFPKSANSSKETMNRFTPRVFWTILAITLVGAGGLALVGKTAIRILFSNAFLDAYVPLLVLLPGVILLGAGKVLTNDIAGRGYPQYNSITSGASLVITIILDLGFIPAMGVVGAALASTLSYVAHFIISVWCYLHVAGQPCKTGAQ